MLKEVGLGMGDLRCAESRVAACMDVGVEDRWVNMWVEGGEGV